MDLKAFDLKSGQNLKLNIEAGNLPTETAESYQPARIKRIAGDELKGVLLAPDGKRAADAQVALQIEGQYLALGKAAFESDQLLREGWIVRTASDGRFTLPNCEGAKFIMALNEEGFAKMTVDDFKASHQLALQKWGRVEGSLRLHGHPATNEWISLGFKNSPQFQLFYQPKAFEARTDDQGRFAFALVPPGEHSVMRRINITAHSWSSYDLGEIKVKPGETVTANFAPSGRLVVGRLDVGTNDLDFKNQRPLIRTPVSKWMKRFFELKTDEERKAYAETDEARTAMKNQRTYVASLSADGSFRAEDVPPGKYEIEIQPHLPVDMRSGESRNTFTEFISAAEFVVPKSKNENDDTTVDLGTVTLQQFTYAIPQQRSSVK